MKARIWRAPTYVCIRTGEIPDGGLEIEQGKFRSGRSIYCDEENREFTPMLDNRPWKDLPLEKGT